MGGEVASLGRLGALAFFASGSVVGSILTGMRAPLSQLMVPVPDAVLYSTDQPARL